jgi:hypothetical protein
MNNFSLCEIARGFLKQENSATATSQLKAIARTGAPPVQRTKVQDGRQIKATIQDPREPFVGHTSEAADGAETATF